jgi:hypothetical protein
VFIAAAQRCFLRIRLRAGLCYEATELFFKAWAITKSCGEARNTSHVRREVTRVRLRSGALFQSKQEEKKHV